MCSRCPDARTALTVALTAAMALLAGCEREARRFEAPRAAAAAPAVRKTDLQPGQALAAAPAGAASMPSTPYRYEDNAYAVAQGARLYRWYNCSGCHAPGGGGDWGPPLSDERWLYGSSPEAVFSSIVEGRPGGMPSFGGHVPEDEVWQLVAFVRSLSGRLRSDVAPGRTDGMAGREPPTRRTEEAPRRQEQPDGVVR